MVAGDVDPLAPAAWVSILIATTTLVGVAVGRLPGVPLDRAGFALVGAALLLATGILDLHEAVALVDAEVIVLLAGLMLLNEALAEAGFFRSVTEWATRRARTPLGLLISLVIASGVLSALFLNDTIVLMLTPLVIQLTRRLRIAPLPYLLALATAANVGSVATITGNPQNLIVSVAGTIAYGDFARGRQDRLLGVRRDRRADHPDHADDRRPVDGAVRRTRAWTRNGASSGSSDEKGRARRRGLAPGASTTVSAAALTQAPRA